MKQSNDSSRLLGVRIRAIRTARGMSQEELAFKSSISAAHLGQIERATKNPTVDTVGKIANALGISIPELFSFETPMPQGERSATMNKIIANLSAMSDSQQRDILKLIRTFRHYRDEEE